MKPVRQHGYLPVLIVAAVVLAYLNSFSGPFIFDDDRVIVGDPHAGQLWPIELKSRIVTVFSFRLNHVIGGMNAADYRIFNVVLHSLAGLLLYGFVRRTLLLPVFRDRYAKHARCLAMMIALLWAVHPLQTESVTYICQRFELLMGFCFLLSLYAFSRGIAMAGKAAKGWFALCLSSCVVGMGTKEVMVTLPPTLLIYDFLLHSRGSWKAARSRLGIHLALFASWGVFAGLMLWEMAGGTFHATGTVFHIPVHRYLFTQFGVLLHYLRLSVVPYPLCLDYGWLPAEGVVEILVPGLLVGTLGILTAWALWRRNAAAFLGAWFFLILAPTSSIMPIADPAFEHRMYLPLAAVVAGIVLLVFSGARRLLSGQNKQAACVLLSLAFGAVVLVFGWLTVARNRDYQSLQKMWRNVVEQRKDNYRAAIALAASCVENGDAASAEAVARSLIERMESVRGGESSRYLVERANMFYPSARNELGRALFHQGDMEGAIREFRSALEVRPDYALAWYNLALAETARNRDEAAVDAVNKAVEIKPDYSAAHLLRAEMLSRTGRYVEAVQSYRRALEFGSRNAAAKSKLAWILATCKDDAVRDGHKALVLAQQALRQAGPNSVKSWDVVAAALAEVGDFDKAVQAAGRALSQLAENRGSGAPGPEEQAIAGRLELYRERKAYRE